MFEDKIEVSGQIVTLNEYSALRRERLQEVYEDVAKFVEKKQKKTNVEVTVDDLTIDEKAAFWQKTAQVLWKEELPIEFFQSKEFEVSLLEKSERFFLTKRNYL